MAAIAETALKRSYEAGTIASVVASHQSDIDRGWAVARATLVRNEIAAAAARGLPDVAQRWQIWNEVVTAMDEAEAAEYKRPGCCKLSMIWIQQLFCIIEFAFRIMWHAFFAGFWGALAYCRKEDPTVLANAGYHGLAISAYTAASASIRYNLSHPSKPCRGTGVKVPLDRPVPPIAAGETIKPDEPEDTIHVRGLLQNLCFVSKVKHPLAHVDRLLTGMFCCMSGPRSCHPGTTCGPCCMCCRSCYNTVPQRITTWDQKLQKKRDPKLLDFYRRTFGVNSYEEYIQKRLTEMASGAPEPVSAMQRGADVRDIEEGLTLGVLEALVGHGPARDGNASEPARAALGVFKGMVGIAPKAGEHMEEAGAQRGQAMSSSVLSAMAVVQAVMGDLSRQATERSANTQQSLQHLKDRAGEETKNIDAV